MAKIGDHLVEAERCEREALLQRDPTLRKHLLELAATLRSVADRPKLPSEKERDALAPKRPH
jgi:hypothetical protein